MEDEFMHVYDQEDEPEFDGKVVVAVDDDRVVLIRDDQGIRIPREKWSQIVEFVSLHWGDNDRRANQSSY